MASFTKTMNAINNLAAKRRDMIAGLAALEIAAQTILDTLAKKSSPYKKGQIFKSNSSKVWVKVQMVSAAKLRHGAPGPEYYSAPYVLDCNRCNVKGVIEKDKWVFIDGRDVATGWSLIESEV